MLEIALPRLNCDFGFKAAYDATDKKNLEAMEKFSGRKIFFGNA